MCGPCVGKSLFSSLSKCSREARFLLQFVVFVFVVASARDLEVARFSGLNLRCGEKALNLTPESSFISVKKRATQWTFHR